MTPIPIFYREFQALQLIVLAAFVAGANGVSAERGERYGHFYVENFRQVTALPKCKSISIKIGLCKLGCMNYKTAYSLKQFLPPVPKMATLKTATTRLFTSLCF